MAIKTLRVFQEFTAEGYVPMPIAGNIDYGVTVASSFPSTTPSSFQTDDPDIDVTVTEMTDFYVWIRSNGTAWNKNYTRNVRVYPDSPLINNVVMGIIIANANNGLPIGGTTGQILSKIDGDDYHAEWIDNYADWTSQLKHTVKAGVALTKGQAVYVSSADGTNMVVSKASNTTEALSSKTLGLIAQNLANNAKGFVITEGLLSGLNTSSATAGDPVWLGVDGNLIYGLTNKPFAPAHLVFIGIVTRSNNNNGEIFVKVQNGFELQELHNVQITSVANKNALIYDSTTSLWKNVNLFGTQGYIPYYDDTLYLKASPLFTNGTNIGIGTTSLTSRLTIAGTGAGGDSALTSFVFNNPAGIVSNIQNSDISGWSSLRFLNNSGTRIGSVGSGNASASFFPNTTYLFSQNGNSLVLATSSTAIPTTRIFITAGTGNVLINTTTDAGYRLDVNGTARITSSLTANSFVKIGATDSDILLGGGGTLSTSLLITGSISVGYIPYASAINNLGNSSIYTNGTELAINTTTLITGVPLRVNGTVSVNALWFNTSPVLRDISGNLTISVLSSGTSIKLQNYAGQQMALFKSNGVALIGDNYDNLVDKLQVDGSVLSTAFKTVGGTSGQLTLGNGGLLAIADLPFLVNVNGTNNYVIKYSGINNAIESQIFDNGTGVGINTTTISERLNINGYILATGYKVPSGTSSGFLKADGSIDTSSYITISSLIGYVPYTGATANLNLGDYELNSNNVNINGDSYGSGGALRIKQFSASQSGLENYSSISTLTSGVYNFASYIQGVGAPEFKIFALEPSSLTTNVLRTYTLPDANGTLALTSDLHNAVTLGTANGLSLSGQQLSLGLASSSSNGALSSTDWTTFNNKQNALTNPITGTGTTNYIPKFTGTSALGNSLIYDNGTNVGINTTSVSGGKLNINFSALGTNNMLTFSVQDGTYNPTVYIRQITTVAPNSHYLEFNSGYSTQVGFSNYVFNNGAIGIGNSTLTGYSLRISKNITGATTAYGVRQDGEVQSGVTNVAYGFANFINTQATTFTLNQYVHFIAGLQTIGSGSTLNSQYGFFAGSNLTGATNNYGFFGAIASGTGRWNLYMNGTANNYLAGSLGIGSTSLTSTSLGISKEVTGATVASAIDISGSVLSDVTSIAFGVSTFLNTQQATFTLGSYRHFHANQGAIRSGSAVSEQMAFYANSNLTGATNNYGFFGAIASGTGRWNLYMSGTANNYLAGNLSIGTTTTTYKLNWQSGTNFGFLDLAVGGAIAGSMGFFDIYTGATPASRLRVESAGNVSIGRLTSTTASDNLTVGNSTATTLGITSNRAGGTTAAPKYLDLNFRGYFDDVMATIRSWDESGSTSNGYLTFSVRQFTGGVGTLNERMRIAPTGNVGVGTTTPVYRLHVVNSGNALLQLNGSNTTGALDTGFTISADSSKNIYLYQRENAASIFATNNTERLRISATGNVSIGNTNNTYKLEVTGTGYFSSTLTANSFVKIGGTSSQYLMADGSVTTGGSITGSGTSNFIARWTSSTALGIGSLYDDGSNVSIGTVPSTVYKFNVLGISGKYISFWTPSIGGTNENGIMSHNGNGLSGLTNFAYQALAHFFNTTTYINASSGVTGGGTLQVGGDVNITGAFKINGTPIGTGGGGVSGSGSSGFIAKWSGSTSLTNSNIYLLSNGIGIDISTLFKYSLDLYSASVVGVSVTEYSNSSNYADFRQTLKSLTFETGLTSSGTKYTPIILSSSGNMYMNYNSGATLMIDAFANDTTKRVSLGVINSVDTYATVRFADNNTNYNGVGFGYGSLAGGSRGLIYGIAPNSTTQSFIHFVVSNGSGAGGGANWTNTLTIKHNTINVGAPSSATGLSSGDVYKDASGFLKIV